MTRELIWRPLAFTDIPALAGLLAAVEHADGTSEHFDVADLSEALDDATLDLAADTIAVLDGTKLVGMGIVRGQSIVRDVHGVSLWGAVHPEHRGQGIGRGILAQQLHRGTHLHAERHPANPGRLEVRPYDHCTDHVRLAKAAGLTAVRHWYDMDRDLAEPLPDVPELAAPLHVVGYEPHHDDDARSLHNVAFADAFEVTDQDPDNWRAWFTGSRAFRPDLSWMVFSGDSLVAMLLSYFYTADALADGFAEGWIGQVATLPTYRRHGIGTALLARALHAYRAAGFARAALDADTGSDIGGLAIYSKLGFRVARKRTSFVRLIPPAS